MSRLAKGSLMLLIGVGAILIAFACREINSPTDRATSKLNAVALPKSPTKTMDELSPAVRARLESSNEQMAWVGRLHSEAAQDFFSNRGYWTGGGNSREAECNGVARVTLKYAAKANNLAGLHISVAELQQSVREAIGHTKECAGLPLASVFASGMSGSLVATLQAPEGDVTGDFEPYIEQLVTASSEATSLSALTTAVENIEASAASISANDYYVLAAAGSLTTSSGTYWNANGGGTCIEREDCRPLEMSIFRGGYPFPWIIWVIKVTSVDLLACAAGVGSAYHAGHRDPVYLAIECAIWGVPASIAYAI